MSASLKCPDCGGERPVDLEAEAERIARIVETVRGELVSAMTVELSKRLSRSATENIMRAVIGQLEPLNVETLKAMFAEE